MKIFRYLFLFAVLLPLAACSPQEETPLVLYSGRSESLVAPIIEQFTTETGIEVEVRYGGTAEMAATILEEGANSPADLFWAQDPGGLGAVAAAGLFAELPDDLLDRVPPGFRSPEGTWVGISGRSRVVVYNTDMLSADDLPDDIMGFTDPAWSGRIGWAPTNGSLQVMVTAMRQIWGEDEARAWLEGIIANNPVVYENNTSIVAAVAAGEVEVGFVNHYYLYRFLAEEGESFSARNAFLDSGGPGSLVMVAGAGVLASSDNEEYAQAFLDFLLGTTAQAYFAEETFEYPVIAGVALPSELPVLESLTSPAINLADLEDLAGTVELLQSTGALP
ncbi:MAG TPA: iron ABC transporter substrate-binding protein [Anaerolineales bacterium]|nr:iron ABC transporter substrate-binding protein [Anaerolineales bacterium]